MPRIPARDFPTKARWTAAATCGSQVKTFSTGLEPNAEIVQDGNVVVANADSDSVTTIDTAKQQVGATFSADPAPGSPTGRSRTA